MGGGEAGQGGVQHAAARSAAHRDLSLPCTDQANLLTEQCSAVMQRTLQGIMV